MDNYFNVQVPKKPWTIVRPGVKPAPVQSVIDPAKVPVKISIEEESEPSPLYGFRYPKEMLMKP